MNYKKYIELGFKRIDTNCGVTFNHTGYNGFILTKKVNKRQFVEVCSDELDEPKLYIKKHNSEFCHIIPITVEAVADLFSEENGSNYVYQHY